MTVSATDLLYQKSALESIAEYLRNGQRPSDEKCRRYIGVIDDLQTELDPQITRAKEAIATINNMPEVQERNEALSNYRIHDNECEHLPWPVEELRNIRTSAILEALAADSNYPHPR